MVRENWTDYIMKNNNKCTIEGFRKRFTVMNSRNTVIVNPRILYEVKKDTGEITNYHGSSFSMSTVANDIPYKW